MNKKGYTDEQERNMVLDIFQEAGIKTLKTKNITFSNNKTDIDVLGIYKNIIIIVECVGKKHIGEKIKKFATDAELIIKDKEELLEILKNDYPTFYKKIEPEIPTEINKFKIYKLLIDFNKRDKQACVNHILSISNDKKIKIWTYEEYFYFKQVSDSEKEYGRYRIFDFFDIAPIDLDEDSKELMFIAIGNKNENRYLLNLSLPVDILLKHVSLKRILDWNKDGFQRLLDKRKLSKMAKYIEKEKSYPTNIVVLLDSETTVKSLGEKNIKIPSASNTTIQRNTKNHIFLVHIPNKYNSLLVIDGQHRLFSYVNIKDNKKIFNTNILVTAILISSHDGKNEVGAKLFYDINQKQTYIKSEDIIDLISLIQPNSPISQSNKLLKKLNMKGYLKNKIKFKPWEKDKLKRTSLIKYSGLTDIFDKKKSSYKIFYKAYEQQEAIKGYFKFSYEVIKKYLQVVFNLSEQKLGKKKFGQCASDTSIKEFYLFSAVFIGSLIRLLRHFIVEFNKRNESSEKILEEFEKIFEEKISFVIEKYKFTKEEFDKKEGWGANKWAKIESDLFYLIRKKDRDFGNANLLSKKFRQNL